MSIIRGSALTGYTDQVHAIGGNARAYADAARVPFDDIGCHDRYIPLRNGIRLLEDVAAGLRVPDFGRRLAKRQGIEILGAVGLAGRNAATVGDAFAVFETFMASYSPAIHTRMVPHRKTDLRRFGFSYWLDPQPDQAQAIELSLGVVLQLLRRFLGADYRPVAVHLPHAPMTSEEDYAGYFRCPAQFQAPVAGFSLRVEDLARPLPTDHLARQTAVDYLTTTLGDVSPSTTILVRTLVRQALPLGECGLPGVAGQLGLHPKTLQRRLAAEDAVFGDLVDDVRRETARHLLVDTTIGFDQVSRQIGYAEQSVLTRSCKRWFGMTPRDIRRTRSTNGA
ncbi:AraC family transcriptional regulator [Gordonia crocea]|uniref:Putative transcriptional regulatory protein n=1 Tax=Gordonia crocea TaxID=589162 RepID=A0A7I9V1K2_9ACTN|nr:AraC family transcriptional regulator [Gordonia crocea]GED98889.1 putative transcriptional regulatory protein [Gordonia crocea]